MLRHAALALGPTWGPTRQHVCSTLVLNNRRTQISPAYVAWTIFSIFTKALQFTERQILGGQSRQHRVDLPGARPEPVAAPKTAAPPINSRMNTTPSSIVMFPDETMGSCAVTELAMAEYWSPGNRHPWSTRIQPTTFCMIKPSGMMYAHSGKHWEHAAVWPKQVFAYFSPPMVDGKIMENDATSAYASISRCQCPPSPLFERETTEKGRKSILQHFSP